MIYLFILVPTVPKNLALQVCEERKLVWQLMLTFGAITFYLKQGQRRSVISSFWFFGRFQDDINMSGIL